MKPLRNTWWVCQSRENNRVEKIPPQRRNARHCPVRTPTEIKLSFRNNASADAPWLIPCATGVKQFRAQNGVPSQRRRNCTRATCETLRHGQYVLVNGLEEFPLVLPDSGMVHLPHQLGVLVDEPGLPENVCSSVLHLRLREYMVTHTAQTVVSGWDTLSWLVSYMSLIALV